MSTSAAPFPANRSPAIGSTWKKLTAGTYNLCEQAGKPAFCARRIVALAATTITLLKDAGGNDEPPGDVSANFTHDADTSNITIASGSVFVYW